MIQTLLTQFQTELIEKPQQRSLFLRMQTLIQRLQTQPRLQLRLGLETESLKRGLKEFQKEALTSELHQRLDSLLLGEND